MTSATIHLFGRVLDRTGTHAYAFVDGDVAIKIIAYRHRNVFVVRVRSTVGDRITELDGAGDSWSSAERAWNLNADSTYEGRTLKGRLSTARIP